MNDGGPAFPHRSGSNLALGVENDHRQGMSLRDFFAAAVLPACVPPNTATHREVIADRERIEHIVNVAGVAELAFRIADQMLARSKQEPKP